MSTARRPLRSVGAAYLEATASYLDNLLGLALVAALPAAALGGLAAWLIGERHVDFLPWLLARTSIDAILGPTWALLGLRLSRSDSFFRPAGPGALLSTARAGYVRAFKLYLLAALLVHPLQATLALAVLVLLALPASDPVGWLEERGPLLARRRGWAGWMLLGTAPLVLLGTAWQFGAVIADVQALQEGAGAMALVQAIRALVAVWGWTLLARVSRAFPDSTSDERIA